LSKVYISLGTNLGNKTQNLKTACDLISKNIGIIEQKSSIYETEPWGYDSFNNFLNQVIEVETELTPKILLQRLLLIEEKMGRKRLDVNNYQDRIIDLDILLYANLVINDAEIKIPHPKMHERKFMLEPLLEISKGLIHPILNKNVAELLNQLS
jgi:2-amino-4-hydroxy-6-hydroxymethyldihydropteridine diphosphokinase